MTIITYYNWSFRVLNNGIVEVAPSTRSKDGKITIGEFRERSLEELIYVSGFEFDLIRQHLSQLTTQLPPEPTPMPIVEKFSEPEQSPTEPR